MSEDQEQSEETAEQVEVNLHYALPQADLFFRQQPAIQEGPREKWQAARQLIDFGGALLRAHNQLRPDRRLRDAVLTAILRRALITAESIWALLARGLEESAVALSRSLIDIELNLKLITRDSTDRMAKRFAAYHYYGSQRHGQKMLQDHETRASLTKHYGSIAETIGVARSYAKYLEQPIFDEVRDELKAAKYWHGYASVRDAFEAVGDTATYHTLYDSCTFFVHDTNVDHDFSEILNGELRAKALVERDPKRVQLYLGGMALRLWSILSVYVEERGLPDEFSRSPAGTEPEAPDSIELDSFSGATHLILEHFGELPQAGAGRAAVAVAEERRPE